MMADGDQQMKPQSTRTSLLNPSGLPALFHRLISYKIYSVHSSRGMVSKAYLERAVKVNQMSKGEKAKVGL